MLDKMRSAPAVGESVAIDRGGLVVTASEAACAKKVAGAGVAFGVPRESADGIVTSCLVALTLRNSGTAPVRVGVTPHASRYVNRLEVAAPADATPTDLELGAYSRDGLDAEPIVYAARHGDRLIYYSWDRHVDRPRLDATLAQGEEIRLLVGFDNDRPNGPDAPPSLDRRASPIVLMHVGGTFWRTLPLDQ